MHGAARRVGRFAVGAVVMVAGAAGAADRACTTAKPGTLLASAIGIEADASLPSGVLARALAAWRGCAAAGTGFPMLGRTTRDGSVVRVRYVAGNSQDGRCGYFAGGEIVLFASAIDRNGRPVPCGSPAENLAHELGHALGLGDAPADARCKDFIMASADFRPGRTRAVQPQECAAADAHWQTESEGAVLAHAWRRREEDGRFLPVEAEVATWVPEPARSVEVLAADAFGEWLRAQRTPR